MKELPCWAIMNCDNQTCAARQHHGKECWEIVRELEDYRAEFNICPDCLVSVLKQGSLPFFLPDMAKIAGERGCPLAR